MSRGLGCPDLGLRSHGLRGDCPDLGLRSHSLRGEDVSRARLTGNIISRDAWAISSMSGCRYLS